MSRPCSEQESRSVRAVLFSHVILSPGWGVLSSLQKLRDSSSHSGPGLLNSETRQSLNTLITVLAEYNLAAGAFSHPLPSLTSLSPSLSYRSILSALLPLTASSPTSCPLLPSTDITLPFDESVYPYTPQITATSTTTASLPYHQHLLLYTAASTAAPTFPTTAANRNNGTGWACLYCGKRFKTLFYLDKHLRERHGEKGGGGGEVDGGGGEIDGVDGVCLADYCKVTGCDDSRARALNYYDVNYGPGDGKHVNHQLVGGHRAACDDEDMLRAKRECVALMGSCFGGGVMADALADLNVDMVGELSTHFCIKLTCHAKLHGLAGKESVTKFSNREVWDDNVVYVLPFWRGKIVGILLVAFYIAVYSGVFSIGKAAGLKRRGRGGVGGTLDAIRGVLGSGGGRSASRSLQPMAAKKKQF